MLLQLFSLFLPFPISTQPHWKFWIFEWPGGFKKKLYLSTMLSLSLYIYTFSPFVLYSMRGFFLLWLFFLSHWIFYIKSYVLLEHILVLWVSFLLLRKYYYKCILAYHLFKFLKSIFFLVNLFPLVSVFKIYFGLGVSCCYLFSYAKRSSVFI